MPTYTKFTHRFFDIKGMQHDIVIQKTSVVDTYVIRNSKTNPVILSHNGGSKAEWDNTIIQGQELTFNFVVPQEDVAIIDLIFDSDYQDYKLTYTINVTEVTFIGWVKPENMYKVWDTNAPQVEIQLSATDGLGDLKDIDFSDVTYGPRLTGRKSILSVLKTALTPTNLNLDFAIQLNSYESNAMTSTECLLAKIFVNSELFWPYTSDGLGEPMNFWDVIEGVLKPFNCKFNQYRGKWAVVDLYELDSYEFIYSWTTLAQVSRTGKLNVIDISTNLFKSGIEQQKVHPLKSTVTLVTNETTKSDITGVDLTDWTNSWDIHFASSSILNPEGGISALLLESASGTADNYIELKTPFAASSVDGVDYIKVQFDYCCVAYTEVGSWDNFPSILVRVQVKRPNGSWAEPIIDAPVSLIPNDWKRFDSALYTPFKISESGNYNVRITFQASAPDYWNWDTASFKIMSVYIPKVQGEPGEYQTLTNTNETTQSLYQYNVKGWQKLENTAILSDGADVGKNGSLLWYDGVAYVLTTEWRRFGCAEDIAIIDMYMRTILVNRSLYKNFLRCTIIDRDHILGFNNVLTINSKNYCFSSFSKNYRFGEIEAELIELITAPISDYTAQRTIGLKTASFGGTATPSAFADGYLQVAHGFSIGDVISYNESTGLYALADITDSDHRAVGMVSDVISADRFNYVNDGYIKSDLLVTTLGKYYYLSAVTPGAITVTPTLGTNQVEQRVGFSTPKGFKVEIDNKTGASVPTKIDFVSTATPSIPDYSIYEAKYGQYPQVDLYFIDESGNRVKHSAEPYFVLDSSDLIESINFGEFPDPLTGFILLQ